MTLLEAIKSCDTGQIAGLNQQIIDRLLSYNYLIKINHPLIKCEGRHNNPYLQPKAYECLVKAVERREKKLYVNSCLRTPMQQYILYQQYKNNLCGIRAAAPPPRSNHQSGMAIDVTDPLSWRGYLEKEGWKWLGSWDKWHFDYKGHGVNLGSLQVLEFQKLWNEHNSTCIAEDGIWGNVTAACLLRSPLQGFDKAPVLEKGDFSEEVGQLQLRLRQALGWDSGRLAADCHFGSATYRAVCEFQRRYNLSEDGVVGAKTMEKLLQVASSK